VSYIYSQNLSWYLGALKFIILVAGFYIPLVDKLSFILVDELLLIYGGGLSVISGQLVM